MQMSPMAPSPLSAPTSNQNPPASSSTMSSPVTPLQSLSLGLLSLPPSTSSGMAAAASHRPMPSDHHTGGPEPITAAHPLLENMSAAGSMSPMAPSPLSASTFNQNPPASSSAMRSPAMPLQSLSLGLLSLPPSTSSSSAATAVASHRPMPFGHHTGGPEPITAAHPLLENMSRAGSIAAEPNLGYLLLSPI